MVATFKREVGHFFVRMGLRKPTDYRPHPQKELDYDLLFDDVSRRYPKIMKRLAD